MLTLLVTITYLSLMDSYTDFYMSDYMIWFLTQPTCFILICLTVNIWNYTVHQRYHWDGFLFVNVFFFCIQHANTALCITYKWTFLHYWGNIKTCIDLMHWRHHANILEVRAVVLYTLGNARCSQMHLCMHSCILHVRGLWACDVICKVYNHSSKHL